MHTVSWSDDGDLNGVLVPVGYNFTIFTCVGHVLGAGEPGPSRSVTMVAIQ